MRLANRPQAGRGGSLTGVGHGSRPDPGDRARRPGRERVHPQALAIDQRGDGRESRGHERDTDRQHHDEHAGRDQSSAARTRKAKPAQAAEGRCDEHEAGHAECQPGRTRTRQGRQRHDQHDGCPQQQQPQPARPDEEAERQQAEEDERRHGDRTKRGRFAHHAHRRKASDTQREPADPPRNELPQDRGRQQQGGNHRHQRSQDGSAGDRQDRERQQPGERQGCRQGAGGKPMVLAEDARQPERYQEDEDRDLEARSGKRRSSQKRHHAASQGSTAEKMQHQLEATIPERAVPAQVAEDGQASEEDAQLDGCQPRVPDPDRPREAPPLVVPAGCRWIGLRPRHGRSAPRPVRAWSAAQWRDLRQRAGRPPGGASGPLAVLRSSVRARARRTRAGRWALRAGPR